MNNFFTGSNKGTNFTRSYSRGHSFKFSIWQADQTYNNDEFVQDFVKHNNILWVAKTTSTNVVPSEDLTQTYWEPILEGVSNVEFKQEENKILWKYEDSEEWNFLFELASVSREQIKKMLDDIDFKHGNTYDSELSETSTNAVQNKVITEELAKKANSSEIPTKLSQLEKDIEIGTNSPFEKGEGENSAILKDGENQAISEYSVALGNKNFSGLKGYYWKCIDFENKKIYLSKEQPISFNSLINVSNLSNEDIEKDFEFNYQIGDVISIVNGPKYYDSSVITNILDGVISVDTLQFDTYNDPESIALDDFSICCLAKPQTGLCDLGKYSIANGYDNQALFFAAHSEGVDNKSIGHFSHTEGKSNTAYYAAHAEGWNNIAKGMCSHTEGYGNVANGKYSHVEGYRSITNGEYSHSEGHKTETIGNASHAEGRNSISKGEYSHAEGYQTVTSNQAEHAEGKFNVSNIGSTIHSVGIGTLNSKRKNAHEITIDGKHYILNVGNYGGTKLEGATDVATVINDMPIVKGEADNSAVLKGSNNVASGTFSVAIGADNVFGNINSVSEGDKLEYAKATGYASHAEGAGHALGDYSHAEGGGNTDLTSEGFKTVSTAEGECSHAEGTHTHAKGGSSHAEGNRSKASGTASHAEGRQTIAEGSVSHTEGFNTKTGGTTNENNREAGDLADSGAYAHAEGNATIAKGVSAHSEGRKTIAIGNAAHAEGQDTVAEGYRSHAEGKSTRAIGRSSHTEGEYTIANNTAEHASGQYNKSTKSSDKSQATLFSIGMGTSDSEDGRKNAFEVKQNGDIYIEGVENSLQSELTGLSTEVGKKVDADFVNDAIAAAITTTLNTEV